jgi:TolB-like protein
MLSLLPALLSLALAGDPSSTTMAVLPLAKGTGDQAWDGLGGALAGMLTSDLGDLPTYQLVERDRLDAVLDELALGRSGFIDPHTAQKLGQGVGADTLLTGRYSLVGDQLLLDARVVEVRSGRILAAADAQGPLTDFVAVEKELVTDLLDGLDVHLDGVATRRLMVRAPTEAWEAFHAYGDGVDAQAAGRVEDARVAFEAALQKDPEFALARSALQALRTLLESERARQIVRQDTAHAAAQQRVLDALPPLPRALPTDPAGVMDAAVAFVLRGMALEDQGRSCERYQAMTRWAALQAGPVTEPASVDGVSFRTRVQRKAEELGYAALGADVPGPDASHRPPVDRAGVLRSTWDFVLGGTLNLWVPPGSDLIGALRACTPGPEQPSEIDRLRERLSSWASLHRDERRPTGLTLNESLQLWWAWSSAGQAGATAELQRRAAALLAGRAEDDPARVELRQALEGVMRRADEWAASRARRYGQDEPTLEAVMRAVAAGSGAPVRREGGLGCDFLLDQERNGAMDWVERLDAATDPRSRQFAFDSAGRTFAILRDFGCLVGRAPAFHAIDDVFAFSRAAAARPVVVTEQASVCRSGLHSLETMTTPQAQAGAHTTPESAMWSVYGQMLIWHTTVVWNRCVEAP